MGTEIIPAGEAGEFIITEDMMMRESAATMSAFEILLREEAISRGLAINVEELFSGSMRVRWRKE